MSGAVEAGLWGLLGGTALVFGAGIAYLARVPPRVVAAVTAFGSGVLISALSFDLMEEATASGGFAAATAAGFLAGAAIYTAANIVISRRVEELAVRYNTLSPEVLGDQRRRNGRTASLLTEDVLAALAERVRTPPQAGGLWSGPKVAAWMARHLGMARMQPQRGWKVLKGIGWSVQTLIP
jgi:ZIP family zinc transporter